METAGPSGAILSNIEQSACGKLMLMAIRTAELFIMVVEKRSFLFAITLHMLKKNWRILLCTFASPVITRPLG